MAAFLQSRLRGIAPGAELKSNAIVFPLTVPFATVPVSSEISSDPLGCVQSISPPLKVPPTVLPAWVSVSVVGTVPWHVALSPSNIPVALPIAALQVPATLAGEI
jgi:hypothetical protein